MNNLYIRKSLEIKNKYNLSYFEAYVLLIIMTYQEETDVFDPNLVYKKVKNIEKRGKFITLKGCILTDNDIGRILGLENSRTPINYELSNELTNKAINKMKDLGILKIEKYQIYRDSKEWRRIITCCKRWGNICLQ